MVNCITAGWQHRMSAICLVYAEVGPILAEITQCALPRRAGPLERTISTGTLGMGMVWAHMSVVMVSVYDWKHGTRLGHVALPVRTLESRFHRHLHDSNLGSTVNNVFTPLNWIQVTY